MARWIFMLGGLIVWAVHFVGVYAIASLADVVASADSPEWRAAVGAFSLVCLLAALALMGLSVRLARRAGEAGTERFWAELAAGGAGLAAVGILWQALPAWIGH